jgi:hypothetical protein
MCGRRLCPASGRPGLEHVGVPFGVQPVLSFLEDRLQAVADGEAVRLRVARLRDWFGHAGQLRVGEIGEQPCGPRAVRAPRLGRPPAAVAWDAGFVGHLVMGQVQPMPGRRVLGIARLIQASVAPRSFRLVHRLATACSCRRTAMARHPRAAVDVAARATVHQAASGGL